MMTWASNIRVLLVDLVVDPQPTDENFARVETEALAAAAQR